MKTEQIHKLYMQFEALILRVLKAAEASKVSTLDHFVDVNKMVLIKLNITFSFFLHCSKTLINVIKLVFMSKYGSCRTL